MHRTRSQNTRAGNGFTLIELMIVVGIIVLLIGILVPALGAARTAARKTQTQSLLTQVANAAQSFTTEYRRPPGYFRSEVASQDNVQAHGFTENENVLLDLFPASIMPDQTGQEAETQGIVRVGVNDTTDLLVSTTIMESGESSFLRVGKGVIQRVAGQTSRDEVDGNSTRLPEIVDPFGMPLLIFSAKPADRANRATYRFGAENIDDTPNASFYWATNAGYTLSEGLGLADSPARTKQSIPGAPDTERFSLLGLSGGNPTPVDVAASLAGILGNPGFAASRDLADFPEYASPEAPRGAFNVISAGPDRVYFSSEQDPGGIQAGMRDYVIGYLRYDSGGVPPGPQPGTAEIDNFDDIIVSGN